MLLASVAACDEAQPGGGSAAQPIVIADSAVHVVGTSASIATVDDLTVVGDSIIWVMNSVEPFFVALSTAGESVRAFGVRGGGPEEFGAPAGFVVNDLDGEAWIFDRQRNALIEVSRPDSIRGRLPLPGESLEPGRVTPGMDLLGRVVRTGRLGNEIVLPRRSAQGESNVFGYWLSGWTADLVAWDVESESTRTVVALGDVLGDPRAHFDLSGTYLPVPLWYRLWSVCGNAEIRVFDRMRNQVRGFASDGTEIEAVALPPTRYTEITPEEFIRATFYVGVIEAMSDVTGRTDVSPQDSARILQGLRSRLDAPPAQLANLLPRYTDFRCDWNGTLWLRPLDLDFGILEGGPVWIRISADGTHQRMRFPDRFDPYRFSVQRVWGVMRDSLDVATLVWVSIPPRP